MPPKPPPRRGVAKPRRHPRKQCPPSTFLKLWTRPCWVVALYLTGRSQGLYSFTAWTFHHIGHLNAALHTAYRDSGIHISARQVWPRDVESSWFDNERRVNRCPGQTSSGCCSVHRARMAVNRQLLSIELTTSPVIGLHTNIVWRRKLSYSEYSGVECKC